MRGDWNGAVWVFRCCACASLMTACATQSTTEEPGGTALAAFRIQEDPSAYAWEVFRYINRQAAAGTAGVADPSHTRLSTYDDDRDVIWESWAGATMNAYGDSEVFPRNCRPVPWDKLPRPLNPDAAQVTRPLTQEPASRCGANALDVLLEPTPNNCKMWAPSPGTEREVRFNRAAYDYVLCEQLHRHDQLGNLFEEAYKAKNARRVEFPRASKIVKARWVPLFAVDDRKRHHWRTIGPKREVYTLAALHIMTRDAPFWHFSTFIHVDRLMQQVGMPDPHGPKKGKWSNFRLIDTQSAFTDGQGVKTRLWNEKIEDVPSSCITCHANAAVRDDGQPGLSATSELGVPKPTDFWDFDVHERPTKLLVLPTDFVWAIPDRARPCE